MKQHSIYTENFAKNFWSDFKKEVGLIERIYPFSLRLKMSFKFSHVMSWSTIIWYQVLGPSQYVKNVQKTAVGNVESQLN